MATRGYLQKMMKRNNVALHVKHGEAMKVSQTTVEEWKRKLQILIKVSNYVLICS